MNRTTKDYPVATPCRRGNSLHSMRDSCFTLFTQQLLLLLKNQNRGWLCGLASPRYWSLLVYVRWCASQGARWCSAPGWLCFTFAIVATAQIEIGAVVGRYSDCTCCIFRNQSRTSRFSDVQTTEMSWT